MARVPEGRRVERGVEARGVGGGRAVPGQAVAGDTQRGRITRDPGLSVNANQFGAQVGGAMMGFGREVQALGVVQKQLEERRRDTETGVALIKARAELDRRMLEASMQAQQDYEVDGTSLLERTGPVFQQARQDVLASVQQGFRLDEDGLARFDAMAETLIGTYARQNLVFEHNQRLMQAQRVIGEELDGITKGVLAGGSYREALGRGRDSVNAVRGLFSPDQEAALLDDFEYGVAVARVESAAEMDPVGTFAALAGGGGGEGFEKHKRGILAGESGGDYDALYGFSQREGGPFSGVKVTEMTVDEALEFSKPSGAYAKWVASRNNGVTATPMGAFQVVGSTLRDAKAGLNLKGNEKLTPEMQDRIGEWVYENQGLGAWEGYRPADVDPDLADAINTLSVRDQLKYRGQADRYRRAEGQRFLSRAGDHFANIEYYGRGLEGFNLEAGEKYFTPEEMAGLRQREREALHTHVEMEGIRYGTARDAVEGVVAMRAAPGSADIEAKRRRQALAEETYRARLKGLQTDPVGYVQGGFEEVERAYATAAETGAPEDFEDAVDLAKDLQTRMGVPAYYQRALPVSTAKGIVDGMVNESSDQQAAAVKSLMEQSGDYADAVANELRSAGLPTELFMAAKHAESPGKAQLIITAGRNAKEIRESLGEQVAGDNKQAVSDMIAPFSASFLMNDYSGAKVGLLNDMQDTVLNLANLYTRQGRANAVQAAYDDIIGNEMYFDLAGGGVYAPMEIDGFKINDTDIENAARAMRSADKIRDFNPVPFGQGMVAIDEEFTLEDTIRSAAVSGMWVTSPDGLGMVLMVPITLGDGSVLPLALRDKDKNLYTVPFRDAHQARYQPLDAGTVVP